MLSDHKAIHPPAVGKADQRAKADLIDPRLAQAIRRIQPPEEILFFPFQMVLGVHTFVIGLLIDHHPVEPQGFQLGILVGRQRLYLHMQRGKLAADCRQVLAEIIHSHLALMLTGYQQQMLKTQVADRGALAGNLGGIQRLALNAVAHREAAVGAVVGAQVGEIQRHVEADGIAEALTGKPLRALGQRFKIPGRRRRKQGHHVVAGQLFGRQRLFDIGGGFTVDAQADVVPLQLPPAIAKGFHASASRNPVSGLVACACALRAPGPA